MLALTASRFCAAALNRERRLKAGPVVSAKEVTYGRRREGKVGVREGGDGRGNIQYTTNMSNRKQAKLDVLVTSESNRAVLPRVPVFFCGTFLHSKGARKIMQLFNMNERFFSRRVVVQLPRDSYTRTRTRTRTHTHVGTRENEARESFHRPIC